MEMIRPEIIYSPGAGSGSSFKMMKPISLCRAGRSANGSTQRGDVARSLKPRSSEITPRSVRVITQFDFTAYFFETV
jgi:hypothetical protein